MNGYNVIPYGRKWAVRKPDGLVRCVVDDHEFAMSIAYDCTAEISNVRLGKPVLCVETGKQYLTATDAAHAVGVSRGFLITSACKHGTRSGGYHWRLLRKEIQD